LIFGPAYLDRVVRVDRPLVDPALGGKPLDGSVDGRVIEPGAGLLLVDPIGNRLEIDVSGRSWPGPSGRIGLSRPLSAPGGGSWTRLVEAVGWRDDLGGMGAGFAAALGGELVSSLGPEADPASQTIQRLLAEAGVTHHPIRVAHPADWTLLVTSGEHGDKLPVGFRGCHAALPALGGWTDRWTPLRVVAALPNRLAAEALKGPAAVRAFAPAMRNMLDRDPPVSGFADLIDILCCNRGEWEALLDREPVAWQVSILVVTDGPAGATLRYTTPEGEAGRLSIPAFPRSRPPADTNRAGEAFASTLLATLLGQGWTPGVTDPALARLAAERAAAASALVLDRLDFGFPTPGEIDAALRAGVVG
jgi:ribokinase